MAAAACGWKSAAGADRTDLTITTADDRRSGTNPHTLKSSLALCFSYTWRHDPMLGAGHNCSTFTRFTDLSQ
jgi:hypothetical protein